MLNALLICFFILLQCSDQSQKPCASRKIDDGAYVCVCNATYCDTLEVDEVPCNGAHVYISSRDGRRFEKRILKSISLNTEGFSGHTLIDTIVAGVGGVSPGSEADYKQEIFGFGGAFTDAAAMHWSRAKKTDKLLADQLTKAYFSKGGLEYNFGRVPIASCDFSTRVYSYDDFPGDYKMHNFSLAEEDELKKKFINAAIKEIIKSGGDKLYLFASPWSSPSWMKNTGKMAGGGVLINSTKIYEAYALYFYKFFTEFNVPWWGVTIENEPDIATIDWSWQALQYNSESMRDFLKNYLGPMLEKLPFELKIMILDGAYSNLPKWADVIYGDPVANKYASGAAVHWYGYSHYDAKYLEETNRKHPEKFIMATEACTGYFGKERGVRLGNWTRAEQYADNIIMDLNNYVRGWVDWNLILDLNGGPNWAKNWVDAPIIYNETEFYKQPMYYALGHFSKFIPRGSRISTISIDFMHTTPFPIYHAAALKPNGEKAAVFLNKEDRNITILIGDMADLEMKNNIFLVELPPHSIATVNICRSFC